MRKVLVTGGLGFIGSHLCNYLQKGKDINLTVIDNYSSNPQWLPSCTVIARDVMSVPSYVYYDQDIVIHLAGVVGTPACQVNPQHAYNVNVNATEYLINSVRKDAKIIFLSSTAVYGDKNGINVTEKTDPQPLTLYGHHKMAGEILVKKIKNWIIFRPATTFGGSLNMRVDLLPNNLMYLALTKGEIDLFEPHVTRPFIHVEDLARAIEQAVYSGMSWNEVYNIGNNRLTMTKEKLARRIGKYAKASITIREGSDPDKRDYKISFNKLYKTGFRPLYNIQYGFNQVKRWLLEINSDYGAFDTVTKLRRYLERKEQ